MNPEIPPIKLINRICTIGLAILLAGLLAACGSLFPSVPAERAADKVLDDILVKKPKDTQVANPERVNS